MEAMVFGAVLQQPSGAYLHGSSSRKAKQFSHYNKVALCSMPPHATILQLITLP
jgi:hypothetical protein